MKLRFVTCVPSTVFFTVVNINDFRTLVLFDREKERSQGSGGHVSRDADDGDEGSHLRWIHRRYFLAITFFYTKNPHLCSHASLETVQT